MGRLSILIIILLIVLIIVILKLRDYFKQKLEKERSQLKGSFEKYYARLEKEKSEWEQYKKAELDRLKNQQEKLTELQAKLLEREQHIQEIKDQAQALKKQYEEKLAKLSNVDKQKLQEELKKEFEEDLTAYFAQKLKEYEKQLEINKEELAKKQLLEAMQSVAVDVVADYTISRVKLPNPDFKGKIIGRDGRNIRTFEKLAKVDLAIDENGDTITISSYDPIRREVAKLALEYLIKDGRVHPGTIEEYIKKAQANLSNQVIKYGKVLAEQAGWYDAPKEALALIGRMRYRISLGQNLYQHTQEVMLISEQIGKMLNLDVRALKIAALLHDVGKVLTAKVNKPHHHISADLARKWGLSDKIVNIIEAHHGDLPAKYPECAVLQIADALSGSRPGARKDDVQGFVERVGSLEEKAYEIAKDKAQSIFALKAGRQLWIVVKPEELDDNGAALLAHKIAKGIEESGVFPGEVEVIVVREVKAFAKAHKQVKKHK